MIFLSESMRLHSIYFTKFFFFRVLKMTATSFCPVIRDFDHFSKTIKSNLTTSSSYAFHLEQAIVFWVMFMKEEMTQFFSSTGNSLTSWTLFLGKNAFEKKHYTPPFHKSLFSSKNTFSFFVFFTSFVGRSCSCCISHFLKISTVCDVLRS